MDDEKLEELKKQTVVDNSKLEELLENEITPEMQMEFFEILKESQLFLPVSPSANMFEGIEDAKVGDVFETKEPAGFNINYLTDNDGNRAVPLFTSDGAMKEAGMRSSVMVMFASDLADMLKQSEDYHVVAINPFTAHDIFMPFDAFIGLFEEPTEEEKAFFESLNEILKIMKEKSYVLEDNMAFTFRSEENLMKDKAVDGVFVPNVPFSVSRNPDFCKDLKYTNILLFDKGKRVLPLGNAERDEVDTMIAPGTELKIKEEVDEFTTVWICGEQPFYD